MMTMEHDFQLPLIAELLHNTPSEVPMPSPAVPSWITIFLD